MQPQRSLPRSGQDGGAWPQSGNCVAKRGKTAGVNSPEHEAWTTNSPHCPSSSNAARVRGAIVWCTEQACCLVVPNKGSPPTMAREVPHLPRPATNLRTACGPPTTPRWRTDPRTPQPWAKVGLNLCGALCDCFRPLHARNLARESLPEEARSACPIVAWMLYSSTRLPETWRNRWSNRRRKARPGCRPDLFHRRQFARQEAGIQRPPSTIRDATNGKIPKAM